MNAFSKTLGGGKTADKAPKKGRPAWKPARRLRTAHQNPDFRYRYVDHTDRMNLDNKQEEGWQFVNRETGIPGEHETPDDENFLAGKNVYRELVLMALPEELAKARDAYFQARTDEQTVGIKKELDKGLARSGAKSHGSIVIE